MKEIQRMEKKEKERNEKKKKTNEMMKQFDGYHWLDSFNIYCWMNPINDNHEIVSSYHRFNQTYLQNGNHPINPQCQNHQNRCNHIAEYVWWFPFCKYDWRYLININHEI